MPRYFFHVMDGKAFIDDVGTDLPDLKAAQLDTRKNRVGEVGNAMVAG